MGKYIVEDRKTSHYQKNYKLPFVNMIPAVVWSIPVHQKLFPETSWLMTFGLCAAFIVLYCVLSFMPIIAVVPCVASVIMYTGLCWVFADYIGNDIARIIVKVFIIVFFGFIELSVFGNATVPWLERRSRKIPRVYKMEE